MYTAEFTKVPNNVTFYNLGLASIQVRALALKDAFWMVFLILDVEWLVGVLGF